MGVCAVDNLQNDSDKIRWTVRALTYRVSRTLVSSPAHDRLESAIAIVRIRLDAMPETRVAIPFCDWAQRAACNLDSAERELAEADFEKAWRSLNEARRCILHGMSDSNTLKTIAITLRHESDAKLTGWRAKAVSDLLCDKDGILRPDIADHRDCIVEAHRLLDDQFETTNHRIALRRRHLQNLLAFFVLALAALYFLAKFKFLPDTLSDTHQLLDMMIAGVLGALISVTQSLMQDKLEQKIPAQVIGAFVVWMRPIIGAAAAVAVLVAVEANSVINLFHVGTVANSPVLFALGLLAGYSERFITGTFDRLSDAVVNKT